MLLLQLLNDESITGQLRKECKLCNQPTRYEWRISGGNQHWVTNGGLHLLFLKFILYLVFNISANICVDKCTYIYIHKTDTLLGVRLVFV